MANHTSKTSKPAPKAVYTIVETGGDKPFWNRIGTAFTNRDGSLNVLLNALPVDGKLHVRDPKSDDGASA